MRFAVHSFVTALALSVISSCTIVDHYTGEDVNKQIRQCGLATSAEVLEIWDTGVRLNDNPVIGFRLLVMREDGSSYEAKTKNVVSIVHIPQVQPGSILPVKVHPENSELVALDIYEKE